MKLLYIGAYLAGVAWLLGWEISAVAIGRHDLTISDMTWAVEGPGWGAARYFIAVGMIWLTLHITLGWFR